MPNLPELNLATWRLISASAHDDMQAYTRLKNEINAKDIDVDWADVARFAAHLCAAYIKRDPDWADKLDESLALIEAEAAVGSLYMLGRDDDTTRD